MVVSFNRELFFAAKTSLQLSRLARAAAVAAPPSSLVVSLNSILVPPNFMGLELAAVDLAEM